jgi:CheY-like chemotaxis protein
MRKKILLVDDTVTVTTLEKILLGQDYDYLEARNGEEAFKRARDEQPDLILMDLNMPGTNGIDGLRSLKAHAPTANIPVVIITTRSESSVETQCRTLGCAGFITKPFESDQLQQTVKKFLGR